jgi:hypothetical protein
MGGVIVTGAAAEPAGGQGPLRTPTRRTVPRAVGHADNGTQVLETSGARRGQSLDGSVKALQ